MRNSQRLKRVAKYLASKGLYKEASGIKKLAQSRPSREDIKDRADHISSMSPMMKSSVISETEEMAEGGDPDGMREEYYSGWQDEDFQAVLDILSGDSSDEEDEEDEEGEEDDAISSGRPSQQDLEQKAESIKSKPGMMRFSIISELEDMAEGGDGGGIREDYYSGWEDEDFQTVLDMIG
jgi:hypothetical protein